MDVSAQHARVVACLIEKAETTPDSYPLTTRALQAACNQATNRDPVVDFSERDVDALMLELRQGGLARTVTGSGHRVGKHRHIVDEALGLDGDELAVLAVLVLRGEQTLNEITTRTARYARGPAGDADAVDAAIDRLAGRADPLVVRLERRPGEREPRIAHRWAESAEDVPHPQSPEPVQPTASSHDEQMERAAPSGEPSAASDPAIEVATLRTRVDALEAELAGQRRRLDELFALWEG
ncbi:MAG: DUF480 domain-containing protein [Ilumatobacter sp.]|nr:DUF480 domain-containing protein [Ilumatobacter sp.]